MSYRKEVLPQEVTMKKITSVFVLALIMVGFAGCGKKEEATSAKEADLTGLTKKVEAVAEEVKVKIEDIKVPEAPKDHPAH